MPSLQSGTVGIFDTLRPTDVISLGTGQLAGRFRRCVDNNLAQHFRGEIMQQTLILLKPDAVQRHLIGSIIQRFEKKGLRPAALKLVQADRSLAERHYAVHKGKPFYESLLQFLTSGPTVAMVFEGREAVAVCRNLMGVTDGAKSLPGTIRGDFALSVQNNLIHGSDSPENAATEITLWFEPKELVAYTAADASWIG
jgi:nucleoside-diphosphate kinase